MAPQSSPHTPSIPPAKRNVFGMSSSNRRTSIGNFPVGNLASPSLAVASSPQQPTTPAGSGIPSFRALRSLLPFGPGKNASPGPNLSSPNPSATPRASFGFGSVRRSMTKDRERKMSLHETLPPVLAIERSKSDSQVEDTNIRRSVSLSRLDEPLLTEPLERSSESAPILRTPSPGIPLSQELSTIMEADSSGVSKHVPIFGPYSRSPSPVNLNRGVLQPAKTNRRVFSEADTDTSMLDLSPSQLTQEVMDAMRSSDSPSTSALDWASADKAVIIDADGPNDTFSLDASVLPSVDPGLAELLSPNSLGRKPGRRQAASFLPRLRNSSASPVSSPITPRFPTTPVTPTSAAATPMQSPSKARRSTSPVKASPPQRSPSSPTVSTSTPAPRRSFLSNPTHLFTPAASSSLSASTGSKFFGPSNIGKGRPPASLRKALLGGGGTSPSSRKDGDSSDGGGAGGTSPIPPMISLSPPPSPTKGFARASLDSRRSPIPSSFSDASRRPSLDIPRPALEGTRRSSFELRRGLATTTASSASSSSRTKLSNLFLSRAASPSPEPPSMSLTIDSSPSPASAEPRYDGERSPGGYGGRASFDSIAATRRSFETSRPGSVAKMRERQQQQQQQMRDKVPPPRATTSQRPSTADRLSPAPPTNRTRKRSMSVQERLGDGKNRYGAEFGSASSSRPGSSMSVGYSRRERGSERGGGERGSERGVGGGGGGDSTIGDPTHPKPDWMASRTSAKAFRAAGLLEYDPPGSDRDTSDILSVDSRPHHHHHHPYLSRDRSGSLSQNMSVGSGSSTVLAPSPLSGTGERGGGDRFGLSRAASALGKFGSVRGSSAASEYNPHHGRAHSRMAFSDAGGAVTSNRRGSGSFSTYNGGGGSGGGLMESPTFTASSGSRDRDTPRSTVSTAATSISGYGARDEVRDLRDKHSTEMEALLNALSDSQRTVRMLREENGELRDRLDRTASVEAENEELGQICNELRRECAQLDRENAHLRRQMSGMRLNGSVGRRRAKELSISPQRHHHLLSLRTPVTKQVNGGYQQRHQYQQDDTTHLTVPSSGRDAPVFAHDDDEDEIEIGESNVDDPVRDHTANTNADEEANSPSTPHPVRRRGSAASSIFPSFPANMTMLLHDDTNLGPPSRRNSHYDGVDQYRFPPGGGNNNNAPPQAPAPTSTSSLGKSHKPSSSSSAVSSPRRQQSPSAPPASSHLRAVSGRKGMGYEYGNNRTHSQSISISSAHNISPTTANFSMVTGSPGSLFLKPEHEMFLGDMESLDLGVRLEDSDRQLGLVTDPDEW